MTAPAGVQVSLEEVHAPVPALPTPEYLEDGKPHIIRFFYSAWLGAAALLYIRYI